MTEMNNVYGERDGEKKVELSSKLFEETVPSHFKILEVKLTESKGVFLFGQKLTWADLHLFNAMDRFSAKINLILDSYPLLKKQNEAIRNLPNIAKYLQSRPERDY